MRRPQLLPPPPPLLVVMMTVLLVALSARTSLASSAVHATGTVRHGSLQPENDWVDMEGATSTGEEGADADIDMLRFKTDREGKASVVPLHRRCMHVPTSVCVGMTEATGTTLFAATHATKGLVGSWDFETEGALDGSGGFRALVPAPKAGPGFQSDASAHFTGRHKAPSVVEGSKNLLGGGTTATVEFWLFLKSDSIGGFQTLFRKGRESRHAPSIRLSEQRRVVVTVDTMTMLGPQQAVAESTVGIRLRRWTHVAVTIEGRIVRVFVNGILDHESLLPGRPTPNRDPVFVGGSPGQPGGPACFLDTLRVYTRALDTAEIQAIGSAAFPGHHVSDVRIGCRECAHADAVTSCPQFYAICTQQELRGGALSVARAQGWLEDLSDVNTVVWHAESTGDMTHIGTGLCCRDQSK